MVQQILKGEKTLAEVSRELDIQPTVIRNQLPRHLVTLGQLVEGATAIDEGREQRDPRNQCRRAHPKILWPFPSNSRRSSSW